MQGPHLNYNFVKIGGSIDGPKRKYLRFTYFLNLGLKYQIEKNQIPPYKNVNFKYFKIYNGLIDYLYASLNLSDVEHKKI